VSYGLTLLLGGEDILVGFRLGMVKVPSMLEVKVVIICLFRSSSGSMLTRFMENMALLELRQATLPWDNYTSCLLEIVILFSVFGF